MKSIKKKLSIIALAASILGCKSAMAMAPISGNSLTSAGYEYFNGKKKSGRNGSEEKSKERDKVDISLPIPTLGDFKVLVPGLYLVANEIAGDLGLSDHEFFGKNTIAKAARSGVQYAAKKTPEFVDYLENKRKTAELIKNQKYYDEKSKTEREQYYYENLEKVWLHFGVDSEISEKLVDIMNIQNSDSSLSYNFLSGFFKNGVVPGGYSIAQKIDVSGFRVFVDNLRGASKLDIDRGGRFIFGDMCYEVESVDGFDGYQGMGYYKKLRVTNLNSKSFYKSGYFLNDYADFFWKTNFGY